VSALVLVTWEVTIPLVDVTTGKILVPPLISSMYFMSLGIFSVSCILVLFA
jgi:hypothetical protein